MSAQVIEGDVFDVLPTLAPGSVDCCVTSPPYWMLRSYLPKGHALKPLELGSEPTPAIYVQRMIQVLRLVRGCLADHGTVWLNIGDTYNQDASNGQGRGGSATSGVRGGDPGISRTNKRQAGLDAGNLCLIPWRLAIAAQDDGWLVRSVIVWHKPAPMPSSVQGWSWRRCRVKVKGQAVNPESKKFEAAAAMGGCVNQGSFKARYERGEGVAEWSDCPGCPKCAPNGGLVLRRGSWRPTSSWEPVLLLAKGPGYYADGEAVKTPGAVDSGWARQRAQGVDTWKYNDTPGRVECTGQTIEASTFGSGGANLRDVWTIPAESLSEHLCGACGWLGPGRHLRKHEGERRCPRCQAKALSHYAAFPSELVYRCLAAGTSARGYCPGCGKPWARVVEKEATGKIRIRSTGGLGTEQRREPQGLAPVNGEFQEGVVHKTLGWRPTCPCPPHEPRPGRVLDPFCGSGRTAIQARRLGLDFTGVELNPEYVQMARELIREDSPLFG